MTSDGVYNNNFAIVPLSAFANDLYDNNTDTYYCNIAIKEVPNDYIILGSLFLQ